MSDPITREQAREALSAYASYMAGVKPPAVSNALATVLRFIEQDQATVATLTAEVARYKALLGECADYLDYMEDRGYSSVRYLRSKVKDALTPEPNAFHAGIGELRALDPLPGVDVEAFVRDVRGGDAT